MSDQSSQASGTATETSRGAQEQYAAQQQFDQLFQQIAQQQPGAPGEGYRAFWDLAEETLRAGRRVSEVQALTMAKQEIVRDVASIVLRTLQQNPQLLTGQQQR